MADWRSLSKGCASDERAPQLRSNSESTRPDQPRTIALGTRYERPRTAWSEGARGTGSVCFAMGCDHDMVTESRKGSEGIGCLRPQKWKTNQGETRCYG